MARPKLIIASSESNADILYASGFRAPDPFTFLQKDGKTYILLNDLELDRGRSEAPVDVVDSYSEAAKEVPSKSGRPPSFYKVVASWLTSKGATKLKVPADFPLGIARDLKKSGIDVKPADGPFYAEREIKSRSEVQAIEHAIRIAETGMARGIELLRTTSIKKDGSLSLEGTALTSEILRHEIEIAVIRAGGEARGDSIVACGEQGCDPHTRGTGPLYAHQLIILDIFPRDAKTGWFGDITRTVVRGRASEAQRNLWETCLEGQKTALASIKPGVEGAKIHDAIKSRFADQGYPTSIADGRWQGFFHGTGHGLGLEVHEHPRFSATTFLPGQVMTVEPGIYWPGVGGVRHEDVVLVTKSGMRLLTHFPKPFEI